MDTQFDKIELASPKDAKEILALYRTQLHGLADWDEHYPSEETIEFDLSRDALFVMRNEAGEIIATITLDADEAVEELTCWSKELSPVGELSRLCVRSDMQNQGIARVMMQYAFGVLKDKGYAGVHILVRPTHVIALRSYAKLGFTKVGECELFERQFYCFERKIV